MPGTNWRKNMFWEPCGDLRPLIKGEIEDAWTALIKVEREIKDISLRLDKSCKYMRLGCNLHMVGLMLILTIQTH